MGWVKLICGRRYSYLTGFKFAEYGAERYPITNQTENAFRNGTGSPELLGKL
jgi:hypothetical protein